jgi:cytoskeletal protein RodZ
MFGKRPILKRVAFAAALFITAACGDSPTAPPGIQPQIVNNTDAFSFQITNLNGVTGTYDYTWQNTGTLAKVTHASNAGASGSATVTLRDATGAQVYTGPMATSGETVSSPAGTAGAWTVRVTFTNYSNTQVNFAVVKQ